MSKDKLEAWEEGQCIIDEGWDEHVTDEYDRISGDYKTNLEAGMNDGMDAGEAMVAALNMVGFNR